MVLQLRPVAVRCRGDIDADGDALARGAALDRGARAQHSGDEPEGGRAGEGSRPGHERKWSQRPPSGGPAANEGAGPRSGASTDGRAPGRGTLSAPVALTAMVLTIAALGGVSAAPIPSSLRDVHRIVTLGDSITQQGGEPGGYVSQIG